MRWLPVAASALAVAVGEAAPLKGTPCIRLQAIRRLKTTYGQATSAFAKLDGTPADLKRAEFLESQELAASRVSIGTSPNPSLNDLFVTKAAPGKSLHSGG